MRHGSFYIWNTNISIDKFVGSWWLIVPDEIVQWNGSGVSGFYFNRYDFAVLFDKKLHFMVIVRFVVKKPVSLLYQAFWYNILINAALCISLTGNQIPIAAHDITDTVIHTASGKSYLIKGGYLDIGILDTMKDLLVNFIGAFVYSLFGFFYVRQRNEHQTLSRTASFARGLMVRAAEEQKERLETGSDEK